MQSPEEIARDVVNNFTGDEYWIDKDAAIASVAAVIRAARAAERIRCAVAALDIDDSPIGAAISAAIRRLD